MKRYVTVVLLGLTLLYIAPARKLEPAQFEGAITNGDLAKRFPSLLSKADREIIEAYDFDEAVLEELLADDDFDMNHIEIYDEFLNGETKQSISYALESGKFPNTKSNFYQNIRTVANPDDILVLVNKNFSLPDGYYPEDLVYLDVPLYNPSTLNEANYLREEAAEATANMFAAALTEQGYTLIARSGFRAAESQTQLYNRYIQLNGQAWADSYSARPSHSEHQTGLAIDVTSQSVSLGLVGTFGASQEGAWVAKNCHRFGFIIRYLNGRQEETGYNYEPWHLRYVGIDAATDIYENNLILEYYLLHYRLIDVEN